MIMKTRGYKNKTTYCLYCDENVNYIIDESVEERMVKGLKLLVPIKHTFCCKCNCPVFVYEIEKENQIRVYDAYKQRKNLLTSEEIIAIRRKYNLSQTKLAKLIKVGEKNIARYEAGAIQDNSIDLLIRFVDMFPQTFGLSLEDRTMEIHSGILIVPSTYDAYFKYGESIYENNYCEGGINRGRFKTA